MRIDRAQVQYVAQLARLDLTPEEETELIEHFDKVLTYMEKLNQLNTDNVEPTAHAVEVPGPLREDVVTNHADTDALLQNAPGREDDFFKVPKIIE
jgi:aspartyl-tRNA(Asn)/glutamyl-tRNA(Gln) amidotransferase subunit C